MGSFNFFTPCVFTNSFGESGKVVVDSVVVYNGIMLILIWVWYNTFSIEKVKTGGGLCHLLEFNISLQNDH